MNPVRFTLLVCLIAVLVAFIATFFFPPAHPEKTPAEGRTSAAKAADR